MKDSAEVLVGMSRGHPSSLGLATKVFVNAFVLGNMLVEAAAAVHTPKGPPEIALLPVHRACHFDLGLR